MPKDQSTGQKKRCDKPTIDKVQAAFSLLDEWVKATSHKRKNHAEISDVLNRLNEDDGKIEKSIRVALTSEPVNIYSNSNLQLEAWLKENPKHPGASKVREALEIATPKAKIFNPLAQKLFTELHISQTKLTPKTKKEISDAIGIIKLAISSKYDIAP